ncbi:MAG: ATP-binding cassette domain-containing protein, partial [Bacteroidia bacterium]
FMLNSSILGNVAFLDKNPNIDKVKSCLEKVNLREWVDSLESGLETLVGEHGVSISGGQRQRIAIARALYKNSEIFIFDEVTNNLDVESKEQTLKAISNLKEEGKTAIFITHKEEELGMCDKVLAIKDKKLEIR